MGGNLARGSLETRKIATLRTVQLMVNGLLTGPGASVVKLAAEEHIIGLGLVSDNRMEGSAMGSL